MSGHAFIAGQCSERLRKRQSSSKKSCRQAGGTHHATPPSYLHHMIV